MIPPFPKPHPPRLQRRKRVTIIAGFQCADGILLCADSEQGTSQVTKSQTSKSRLFQLGRATIAIGGAGDGALIDYAVQELIQHLLTQPSLELNTLGDVLNRYASRLFRGHIRPYAGFSSEFIPEVAFLVAIEIGGECRLFKWERNFAYAVPLMTHTSIGIGTIQSEQLINQQQFSFPAEQMLFYAIRVMQKVKQLVQGCGGKTEVFLLRRDGTTVAYGTSTIDAIEHLAEEIDNFFLEHVLAFTSNIGNLSQQSIEETTDMLRQDMIRFRETYVGLVPFQVVSVQPESTPSAPQTPGQEQ
jgi:hypothetical protein